MQGRGRDRAARAQRDDLGLRARPREPRRHRPPERRGRGLDRDPRDRLALSQHLLADRGDGAGAGPTARCVELTQASDPDELRAARVSLGALGVIATMTLRTVPAFTIRRVDSPLPLEETLERIDDLADGSDHFEFYVFPHTDRALLRQSERTDEQPKPREPGHRVRAEVMIENWALGAVARLGRRSPSRVPALSRVRLVEDRQRDQAGPQLPRLREPAPGPLHRDGVRDPAPPRGRGRDPSPRRRRARRPAGRLSDRGPVRRRRRRDAEPGARAGHDLHRGPPVRGRGRGRATSARSRRS